MRIASALATSGLKPNRLELEITEAVLIRDDEAALAILHQLRGLGVRIALDDFGTGYSSLSYLRRFPFDKIKIDRCFVSDIDAADGSSTIVRAVVNIAAALNMTTVAEGVETEPSARCCANSAAPRCRVICSARRSRRPTSRSCSPPGRRKRRWPEIFCHCRGHAQ
jgi:EAL domain-containing protein (putative c-di-GMP-specific phosphodiesterase class I)